MKMMPNTGKAVTNFSIAVPRPFAKDKSDWINIVVYDKQAENAAKYLQKGSKVGIVGYLTIRQWETKDGDKRYATEVIANNVEFLTPKGENTHSDFRPADPVDVGSVPF